MKNKYNVKNSRLPGKHPVLYGPDNRPLSIPAKRIHRLTRRCFSQFVKVVAFIVAAIGFTAAVFEFYTSLPKPAGTGILPSSNVYSTRFTLNNTGGMTMHHVDVVCDYTKLIFQHPVTVKLGNRYLESMYRVPDVGPGEAFTVKCPEPFRWLAAKDMTHAIMTFGDLVPENNARAWYFKIHNGQIESVNMPPNTKIKCEDCVMYPISDLDLTITIKYRTVLPWIRFSIPWKSFTDSVRFIGSKGADGTIAWQPAPMSQPAIKDPASGPIVELSGGPIYATNQVPAAPQP